MENEQQTPLKPKQPYIACTPKRSNNMMLDDSKLTDQVCSTLKFWN